MRIATYNANSIRSRLEAMLAWMQDNQPDILCVQETKVQDDQFPEMAFRELGYAATYRGEKSYNGTAILSKQQPKEVAFGLDDGGPADESRLIRADFGGLVVVNTYVPQGRSLDHEMYAYKLEWFQRLRDYFDRHFTARKRLLWTGDINVAHQPIDVYKPETKKKHVCYHDDVRAAFQATKDWGFVDVYRDQHPDDELYTFYDYRTRDAVDKGIGWRIDYLLATKPLASTCRETWIDVAQRKKPKASDHTYLVGDFDL